MQTLLFAGIGLLAGIAGGFFGIGGAILIIPLLTLLGHFSQHLAQGTTLAALVLPIGILAAWKYWQQGHVNIPAALCIAGGFVIGGWLGGTLAQTTSPDSLKRAFGMLLILIGVRAVLGK